MELAQGWAERPADGGTLGTNYEPYYRPLIDKWYDLGEAHKDRRMSAAMMVRTLRAMFPRNYDYPSERHVKNRITALYEAEQRRRIMEVAEEVAEGKSKDSCFQPTEAVEDVHA